MSWTAPAAETVAWHPVLSPIFTVEGLHTSDTFGSIPGTVVEVNVVVTVKVIVVVVWVDVTVVVVGDVTVDVTVLVVEDVTVWVLV